jgi:membrane protein DedA with SNARE-associated domain
MHHLHDVLVSWGPLGLLILSMVESMGIPNPGGTDILLVVLAAAKPEDAWLCALCAVIGSFVGTTVFFEIMRKGGERYLTRYTSSGRGARFRTWFLRYGLVTVFIPALLPIPFLPFKAFAACSGAMGCSRTRFWLVLVAGRIPRYSVLAYLGAQLGENSWPWVRGHVWHMVVIAVVLSITLYRLIRWSDRNRLQLN